MQNEPIIGIDPVDFKSLDNSTVFWDAKSESWVVDGDSAHCHLYGPPVENLPNGETISWNSPSDTCTANTEFKYDRTLDLEFNKSEFMAYMYILGFSDSEIALTTIDAIVEKIRDVYKYKHGQPCDTASQTYIKRKNIALLRGVRRSFNKIQVIENGH
jgi:hypothetical protein